MLVGPVPVRIVGVDDIESGREAPATRAIHEEGDVLGVVVLVTNEDIEQRAAHQLLDRFASEAELQAAGKPETAEAWLREQGLLRGDEA